ncbi:MAG: excinuclease, partial [Clostridia bacterium]|nr:excinuclease [Clostridia bacterium]
MYDKVCKNCGTYLSDYFNTGMLGCPHCYTAFRQEIKGTLLKIQKSTEHAGKLPTLDGVGKELYAEYKRL